MVRVRGKNGGRRGRGGAREGRKAPPGGRGGVGGRKVGDLRDQELADAIDLEIEEASAPLLPHESL